MNRHCYRVIFNKALARLVVVSEKTHSHTKTSAQGGSQNNPILADSQWSFLSGCYGKLKLSCISVLLSLGVIGVCYASSDASTIIADLSANKHLQPMIVPTASGMVSVNIQAPNDKGLSNNHYSQFDVGGQGVILNNNRKAVATSLAGFVDANPFMARGEASTILNQVNSNKASMLNGFVEVAGQKADVIIANPNGLQINGAGFINAGHVHLVSGTAQILDGRPSAYHVGTGAIVASGKLNAQHTDYTALIAKSMQLNDEIYAGKQLDVITGENLINIQDGKLNQLSATSKQASSSQTSQTANNTTQGVALDISALGGMYAGSIRLIGTDQGLGVNNAGIILSTGNDGARSLSLDIKGNLINTGTIAGKDKLQINAPTLKNLGTISSDSANIALATNHLNNLGTIFSSQVNQITASHHINNQGDIYGGVFDIATNTLNNAGKLIQTGKGQLVIKSDTLTNTNQAVIGQSLYHKTTVDTATTPSTAQASGGVINTKANHTNILSNTNGTQPSTTPIATPVANGSIATQTLTNQDKNALIAATGEIDIAADTSINHNKSSIDVQSLSTKTLSNTNSKLAVNDINWHLTHFDNTQGTLTSKQDITIAAQNSIINQQGVLVGNGKLKLSTESDVNNHQGMIQSAQGDAIILAQNIQNSQGSITASDTLSIMATDSLNNTQGNISAQGDATLTIGTTLNNTDGSIQSAKALTANTQNLSNSGQLYAAKTTFAVSKHLVNNKTGIIASAGDVDILSDTISNTGSVIAGMKADGTLLTTPADLTINATKDLSSSGVHVATNHLQLGGNVLTLTGSQSQAKNITLDSKSTTSTQQAKVVATDTLNMMAPNLLNNTQGVLSASNINIHTEKLNNHQGSISQSGQDDFSLTLNNGLDNRQGSITANAKNFNIHTGTLNNHQGHIKHTGAILGMTVADVNNNQGSILSTGDHTLNVKNVINNHQGIIQANTLTTTAKQLDNSDGKLLTSHHQSLTLTNDINNHQGLIQAGDFTITASQLNNHQGVLLATDDKSQNHITLTGELNNANAAQKAATIATAGNLAMTASKVQNTGNISSRTLDIQADKIHHAGNITAQTNVVMKGDLGIETTQTSLVFAGGDAILSSQSDIAHHGRLTAVNHLSVDAAQLDLSGSTNQAANISYASKADIVHQHATSGATNGIVINNTNGTLSNQQGSITAKTINLDSKALQNGGSIYAKALTIHQIDDYTHTKQDKLIADNLNFNTQGSFTNQGELTANQTLNLTAKSITNDKDATINAANSTHLDSQSYLNNQGLINGNATYIKAKNTINNQAGGRIYGTHLAIAADTLNNTPAKIHDTDTSNTAPVIAARQRLDIGVNYLNNHPNPDRQAKFNQDFLGQALITSLGSLHIGGSLNDNYHAIGKAQKIVNRGATTQSGGQMVIGSHSLLNTNADYQKQTIEVDKQEGLVFYRPQNTAEEHLQSDVDLRNTRKGLSDAVLYTKDSQGNFVNRGEDWDKITRTRIVSQDKTQHSDPARMVSGKNMVLDGMDLINDKSQMNAGNGYRVIAKHLNNNTDTALVGHTVEKFEGGFYQSHTVRWNRGKTKHRHSWGGRVYEPNTQKILETYELPILNANITTTPSKPTINQVALVDNDIDTALEALKSNQSALSSDAQKQLSALLAAKALGQTVDKALLAALINKLPQKIGGKAPTVVHTTPDGLTIPNSALYTINANHPNLPIIQTDPAFTNHKNWLSSEYMLTKLDVDANHIHKRLGDGYYEQKQLQDQYQLLTGRHLLSDYQSQEQAFKTLMDQGITFAKQYQLSLGVALSAEQMANLTTDMVWLVKQPITYTKKDNEGNLITHTQEALVPKLYLRPANTATARLQPDGRYSSIGAKNINMHLTGNLDNGGNITATDALSIQANNAINKGNINAKFVAIDVNQDLINQHRIHVDHAATLTAGHDIINQSQTSHQSQILGQSSASSTHIRQLAQISVGDGAKATDKDGKAPTTLSIKAGNYVIYTGANSQNQGGNTLISADKGIRLDAIKESSTINAIADDNNYFKHSQSKDIGSVVSGQGDVVLVTTSQDAAITGKAVNISSQAGKVLVSAMGDVHFSAGENKESIESTTTHKENKWYGKKDIKNTHESATNKAVLSHIASTAGVQMSSLAGDVSLLGSNIRTRGLASIHAKQGDVTLESVVDSVYQNATQTTQNFYKNTGSIDGSYQEMLNKTGISADGIDIQSKTTNLNAVDLKATNGAIIVGNAHLATDEDGKLKLDGNGKPIIVSGDMQNLSLGTVDLTNETWHEHSKSYRGFAKDLMKGAGVVAGALGIKDGITLAKSERHDAKTNTQAITKFDANHIQIGAQTVIATGTHFDAGTDGSVAILGDDILLTTAEHNQTSNQINTSQAITGEGMKFGKDHLQLGAVVYADTKDMQTTQTTTHDGVIIRGSDVTILANMTNGNLTTYATNFDLGNNTGSLVIGAKNTLLDGVVNQSTNVQSSDINTTRIGASVHHVAVDTAVAAENLKEAIEAANQARKDLATAKDDIKAGRLQADAIKDYEANLAIATANIANAKIALGSTAASAAATALTLGFSAKLGANHTQSQSQQTQANQDFVGTSIKAANVTFIGNDLTAKGLQGDISKLNVDHLNKLTLTHGTTTNTNKSQSSTNTLDASISTSGNMAAGMGRQQSHEGSTSTIAHDTKLNVGELNGYAKETTLHGATIVAQGGHYNTDTLNIHTSQNTQTHQSKHQGSNIGIGTNSLNLGYNQQNSQSDITTNNTPSGIIYITTDKAGDKHSLTAKHTSLTGGVIAAIHQDKDGNQTNDKLNFTTNTLATQDLLATESTQSKGFSANLGLQSKEDSIKVSSIGLSANRNGSDKQTLALATIGQGATINHTITHNGQIQNATDLAQTAINTDATNTSKVIKDIKTGWLDINTTIDSRVFSKAGREEIKREQRELGNNLATIKDDVVSDLKLGYDIASDTYKSILVLKKIEEVRSQLSPEEQEYFDQYLFELQQAQDPLKSNAAPAVAGVAAIGATELTVLVAGTGVAACSATKACSDTVEDGLKDTQKAARKATNAIIDYTVGIFSSDSPKTGNDQLDEILEDATKSDDGNKGYEYPGSQQDLIDKIGSIDGAKIDDKGNGVVVIDLKDGTRINLYPSRTSTGKPGWSITKPGKKKPSIKGDTLE